MCLAVFHIHFLPGVRQLRCSVAQVISHGLYSMTEAH